MNSILFPTDFSKNAEAALNYILYVADRMRAKIIFLHVYHPPVAEIQPGNRSVASLMKEKEKKAFEEIYKLKMQAAEFAFKNNCEILTDHILTLGFTVDETLHAAKELNPNIIAISAGATKKMVLGITSATLIQRSKLPVMVIPEFAEFKNIRNIAYACKLHEKDEEVIKQLLEFGKIFDSKIFVFHIDEKKGNIKIDSIEKYENIFRMALKEQRIQFEVLPQANVLKAIDKYIAEHTIDMLAMTHHKHIFPHIFGKKITGHMSFHSKIPLLVYYVE